MIISKDDIELAKQVQQAAYIRRITYKYSEGLEEVTQTDAYIKAEKDLDRLLNELSFDEIKFLQALMYLGRDSFVEEIEKYSGMELFDSVYNSLSWETQKIETDQISEKMPLDEYIQKGLTILEK